MTGRPASSRLTGLRAWSVQRASAAYLLLFVLFLLLSFTVRPMHTYAQWRAWATRPEITVAFFFFFTALLVHMWVGLRDVLLDYARPVSVRSYLLAAVALGLFALGIYMLFVLLRPWG